MNRSPRQPLIRTAIAALVALAALGGVPARAAPPILCDQYVVPMSDGVRLFGYRNHYETAPQPGPVIISITPYGQGHSGPKSAGPPCARPGDSARAIDDGLSEIFQHVIFHLRGSGVSEGEWDMLGPRTQQDVREVIDWVAAQPWSDGRIMLEGNSGVALFGFYGVQDPRVKLAIIHATCADFWRGCTRPGGGLLTLGPGFLGLTEASWAQDLQTRAQLGLVTNPPPPVQSAAWAQSEASIATHDLYDDYYRSRSALEYVKQANVPVIYTTDTYDIIPTSIYDAFQRTPGARLIVGMGHGTEPIQSLEGYTSTIQSWLVRSVRHYVLGEDNGAENDPRVLVLSALGGREDYRAGKAVVRGESAWPLAETSWERLYLAGGPSGTTSSLNDGILSPAPPSTQDASDAMVVAPVLGPKSDMRINTWFAAPSQVFQATNGADHQQDERIALTYTTPVLSKNLEVTGPIVLRVFASSTAEDFDWVARVNEVWPDGRSEWVTEGFLRASLRRLDPTETVTNDAGDIIRPWFEDDEHEPVPSGDVVEYVIEITPTSNVFRAGHRIRLDLFGAGASTFDSARTARPGRVTIYRDAGRASSLLIPVIPSRCQDSVPIVPEVGQLQACASTLAEAMG